MGCLYLALGLHYHKVGCSSNVMPEYEKAQLIYDAVYKNDNSTSGKSIVYFYKAIFLENQGNRDEALYLYKESLACFSNVDMNDSDYFFRLYVLRGLVKLSMDTSDCAVIEFLWEWGE